MKLNNTEKKNGFGQLHLANCTWLEVTILVNVIFSGWNNYRAQITEHVFLGGSKKLRRALFVFEYCELNILTNC